MEVHKEQFRDLRVPVLVRDQWVGLCCRGVNVVWRGRGTKLKRWAGIRSHRAMLKS